MTEQELKEVFKTYDDISNKLYYTCQGYAEENGLLPNEEKGYAFLDDFYLGKNGKIILCFIDEELEACPTYETVEIKDLLPYYKKEEL